MEERRAASEEAADELDELAGYLKALAHPSRLEILNQLRVPRTMGEIRLKPRRQEAEGNPDRLISRNAVERHLLSLKAIGVVVRRPAARDGRPVDEYLLQHARLFQVVEELRALAALRPRETVRLDATESDDTRVAPVAVATPHLVMLSGPMEGRVVELAGEGPWTVGRGAGSAVALDHDPYLSAEHAVVRRDADGRFHVQDVETNRNGTFLNWRRLPKGALEPLRPSDVLRVGRTLLLFRDPSPPR